MRSLGTAALLIVLLTLTGCGSGGGDADDVPTITTRPSPSATSVPTTPTTAPPTEESTTPTETPTPTTETSGPEPTETGPSPEPPTDDPVGPATYRQAISRIDDVGSSAPAPITTTRFATSKDVVYCLLDDPVIGPSCELRTGFIKDVDTCGGGVADGVGRIETFQGESRPACNTDTIREPGAREVSAPGIVVATGQSIQCAVEPAGVTCVDFDNGVGFFIGPGEYHVF